MPAKRKTTRSTTAKPSQKPVAKKKVVKKAALKKTAPKKAVAKKAPAKKTALKKPVAKKANAKKKPVTKKVSPKKAAVKNAAPKKTISKKAPVKKTSAKKPVVKKTTVKKSVTKKPVAKKTPAKKIAIKEQTPKKATTRKKTAVKTTTATKKNPVTAAPAPTIKRTRLESTSPGSDKVLTEAQLLKMPKKDYMNEAQLTFFRNLLLKLKADTEVHIEEIRQELAAEEREPDENDSATNEEQRAIKLRIVDRETKLIPKILLALRNIEEGIYGYCEETGEPIGIPRLLLRPTATLSIDAKAFREEREKQYFD